MQEYAEKRDFPRMVVNCDAKLIQEGSGETYEAFVKDLSGSGLLIWVDRTVETGSILSIEIKPGSDITPPLSARIKVIRCQPMDDAEAGRFSVACQIEKVG